MRDFLVRFWDSPTISSWLNRVASFSRLLLVLPLLLKSFDEVQIAAWLLFGSLLFFGGLISIQTGTVFARMIAVVYGGARDLSPVLGGEYRESSGKPNWGLFMRLYTTMRTVNLLVSIAGFLVLVLLGYFSLNPLMDDYSGAYEVWYAFGVFAGVNFIWMIFRQYEVTLRGLNQVALTSRWNICITFLSAFLGIFSLLLNGGILALAIAMQTPVLLGIIVQRYLLIYLVEPRCRAMKNWTWDQQIIAWVRIPLSKGILQVLANRGGARIAIVFVARYVDPASLAALLMGLRLLDAWDDFATTPLTSLIPRYGRMLGEGRIKTLKSEIVSRFKLIAIIQFLGICLISIGIYFCLELLEAEIYFVPLSGFFAMAIPHLLACQVRQSLMITMIGNNVVELKRFLLSAGTTCILSVFFIPQLEEVGFIIAAYFPTIIIVNLRALRHGCDLLGVPVRTFLRETVVVPWVLLAVFAVLAILYPWESITIEWAQYIRAKWLRF